MKITVMDNRIQQEGSQNEKSGIFSTLIPRTE